MHPCLSTTTRTIEDSDLSTAFDAQYLSEVLCLISSQLSKIPLIGRQKKTCHASNIKETLGLVEEALAHG